MNPAGQAFIVSCTEQAGAAQDDSALLGKLPNVEEPSASQVLTVPELGQLADWPVAVKPPPSTWARSGIAVAAAAVAYSQFSDTYRPVPVPASA